MTKNETTASADNGDSGYFGVCPTCGKNDGYLNVGKTHWYVCDEHKVRWCIGSNLFSSWQHEDTEIWRRNEEKIRDYVEIEPDYHPTGTSVDLLKARCSQVKTREDGSGTTKEGTAKERMFSDRARLLPNAFETTFTDAHGDISGPHRCAFIEDDGRITACLDAGWLHYMRQLVGDFQTLGDAANVLERSNLFADRESLHLVREETIDELFKVITGLWDHAEKAGAKPNEFVGDGVPF